MLDLVVTFTNRVPDNIILLLPGAISDHSHITCHLPIGVDSPPLTEWLLRGWQRVSRDKLHRALADSQLCSTVPDDMDVDQLFDTYSKVLNSIADQLAPTHAIRRRPGRPTPWFNAECHSMQCTASVSIWNIVIGKQTILPTVDFGCNLRDITLDCIGRKRSSTVD